MIGWMNGRYSTSDPTAEEVRSIGEQIQSGEIVPDGDIQTLIEAVSSTGVETHVYATEGLYLLTEQQERILENEYPEIVEALLSSRQSIEVARELLHGIVALRIREVPIRPINSGLRMARDKLADYVEDIAEKTAGSNEVVPGGGAAELDVARRFEQHADSVAGPKQVVIEEVSNAIKGVPRQYAKQTGADPTDILVDLQARCKPGKPVDAGVSNTGRVVEMDGENESVDAERAFRHCYNGVGAVYFIVHFERTPSQLLRSEAVLTDELR